MDERGYCPIAGRLKDMIIRGGENIYPREIENVLFEHPAVAEVAVVGVPDEKWGEQVAAFVRPAPGATLDPDELFAYCREHLAPHKTPRTGRCRGVAADGLGQDPEVRAAGALRRPGTRRRDTRRGSRHRRRGPARFVIAVAVNGAPKPANMNRSGIP